MILRLGRAAVPAALALSVLAAAPALAQPAAARSHLSADGRSLELFPRERVTIRIVDGALTLVSAAPATDADAAPPKPGVRPPDAPITFLQAPAGSVAFTLGEDGEDSILKVENAMDRAFDYRAAMRSSRGSGPTSVCTALPQMAGYETWNRRRLDALTLSAFAPRATNDVVCPEG